jgi:GNAT superfamily N-acetyltransferase
MQANLIAYFRLFAGLPGITFVEEDVTWLVSAKGEPGNHILRAQLPDDALDRRIGEIISQIGQYTDHIDWLVFPGCQPADLGKRLEAHGMKGGPDGAWMLVGKIGGPGGTWMLADLTSLPGAPVVAGNFHIEYVGNNKMLEVWVQASSAGFGGGDYQRFYDAYARHGFGPDAFSLHYIGYLDDQPVTSSTLLLAGGIASIYDVSTPPALRRQGFGSAITWAMLQEARKRGYQDAWIWSSPLGKSVYSKLGFVAADFGIREYQWQKR